MQNRNESRGLAIGLTILSALGRLLPHAPNVTPLGGSCLFAGARISGMLAYLLPLIVMLVTDPIVAGAGGGYSGYTLTSPIVYASFLINVWLGRRLLRRASPLRVGLTAFLCSLQFFLITSGAAWAIAVAQHSPYYSPGFGGMMRNYAESLPFFARTAAGDLLFAAAIFGMYEILSRRMAAAPATAA